MAKNKEKKNKKTNNVGKHKPVNNETTNEEK